MSNRIRPPRPTFWWIHCVGEEEWAGLRIAVFHPPQGHLQLFHILGETSDRNGPRIWEDASQREGWVKLEPLILPAGFRGDSTR